MQLRSLAVPSTIAIQSAHRPAKHVGKRLLILGTSMPMLLLRTCALLHSFDHVDLGLQH